MADAVSDTGSGRVKGGLGLIVGDAVVAFNKSNVMLPLVTAKQAVMGFGSLNDGVCAGGDTGSYVSVVEVYNGSAWSVGNAMSAVKGYGATSGTSTSAGGFAAGGFNGSTNLNTTDEYAGAVAAKSVTSS